VLEDAALRQRLSQGCRAHDRRVSMRRHLDHMEALYREAARSTGRTGGEDGRLYLAILCQWLSRYAAGLARQCWRR
jgi:hypothetical protein